MLIKFRMITAANMAERTHSHGELGKRTEVRRASYSVRIALLFVTAWIGVTANQDAMVLGQDSEDQAWEMPGFSADSDSQIRFGLDRGQIQDVNATAPQDSELFSWETSETSMGLPRSITSSSYQIFWDLGMSLRHRRLKKPDTPATECEKTLLRVVEHIKNASYTVEVQNILYNTGKVFNDVGYYTSCMNTTNLTYYLIRPTREDLSTKFNFGVCLPLNCSQEAVNVLIADDVINKKWLKHIANGTSYQPEDFTSTATVVPTGQQFSKAATIFMVLIGVLMATTVIRPAFQLVGWVKTINFNPQDDESVEEETGSSESEGHGERSPADHEAASPGLQPAPQEAAQQALEVPSGQPRKGLVQKFIDCWSIWGSLKHLRQGRAHDLNSVNAIKAICAFLIVYSAEYLRRQPVGTNQDDKLSLDRTYQSWGYNLAFMAPVAFDILFFLSAVTNTLFLSMSLQQEISNLSGQQSQGSTGLGFKGALSFYLRSVGSRFMRLGPMLLIVAFTYYEVIPGLVTGPFEYLFATTYSQDCSNSTGWAYSFIANLVKDTNYCTGSFSWYVFSMLQLYMILPLYVLLCRFNSFVGVLFAITLATSSICGTLAVFGIEDLGLIGPYSSATQYQQYQDHYQSKPWAVGYCWFLGAVFGLQLANRRLAELKDSQSSDMSMRLLLASKSNVKDEANKQTIASMNSLTKGSALTLTPNNQESLIGESGGEPKPAEEVKHDLIPAALKHKQVTLSPPLVGEGDELQEESDSSSVGKVAITTTVIALSLAVPVSVFIAFVHFTRTKNDWNSVVQVGFDVVARLTIIATIMVLIWHLGFTHKAAALGQKGYSQFTLLGAMSRFGLAYYLWAMVYIDWGMASQMVNQYYDPLLVFCYTMADSVVLTFTAVPLTLMVEIPIRRLFSMNST